MHFRFVALIFCTLLLISTTKATQKHFMCYVCENCAKVTDKTPLVECNADYFNTGGTTMSSVMTTIAQDSTTPSTENSDSTTVDTTEPTTLIIETTVADTTTELTTEAVKSTTTATTTTEATSTTAASPTTPAPPTPPTIGPAITTPSIPTPPAPGTAPNIVDIVSLNSTQLNDTAEYTVQNNTNEQAAIVTESTLALTTKAYMPSSEFRVRQVRSIAATGVSYHCYSIQKKVNGTMSTERGCSRVNTNESVCSQLQVMNNHTVNKCTPCTLSMCNGSASLATSVVTLLLAVVAAFLHY